MKFIYLGAEVPSNRTLLETTGATHVGVSFWRLTKRGLPKKSAYLLKNYFDDSFYIYVYPGIPKDVVLTEQELEDFAAEYEEFVANNMDRLNVFSEITGESTDSEFVRDQRRAAWSQVPPGKFLPVWDPRTGFAGLHKMAESYLDIGLPGEALETETQLAMVTRTLHRKHGTRFHVLGSAKPDNLRQVAAETASTMSWLSPMMNGETIVWDGSQIKRYPKRMKDQARTRYRNTYTKAGLDVDKILEDDPKEVCRLAVWSYLQYEARLNGMNNDGFLYDNNEGSEVEESGETTPSHIDNKGIQVRKLEPRKPEEMGNLPVFGYDLEAIVEDDGTIKDVTTISSQDTSLRACDTCFVAANCPAFKPQSVCAFKLPVSIKTKDQLKSLINAVIEMQGQRVAFMRFAEEMNGGYADPNVSQEIDRLFKLIKTTKELDDSREFIRMTVERQGSAGVLSSIFGDKAQVLRELPDGGLNEAETTQIIKQSLEDS
jgi:hypothetical protein